MARDKALGEECANAFGKIYWGVEQVSTTINQRSI